MIHDEREESKRGVPLWMVTFGDMMSLLLTFFVFLLSFSNMEIVKFRSMAGSVRNALGLRSPLDLSDTPASDSLLPHFDPKQGRGELDPSEIVRSLERILDDLGMTDTTALLLTRRGVVLQLEGDLLFDSGKAELNPKAYPLLDRLAAFIEGLNYSVEVAGHTDNLPISTSQFPSNWELSAARAGRAVRYLVEKAVPAQRLRAVGHADTIPVASNQTPEGRARNRRVELIFTVPGPAPPQGSLDEIAPQRTRPGRSDGND